MRVLSKLAHGDILGGGNGKIMSYRNSKARILTSCQTAAMLASAARWPRATPPPLPPRQPQSFLLSSQPELSYVLVLDSESFGAEITCRTGEYRADKVPSDPLTVSVKYGKSTVKAIQSAFQFLENPIVLDHQPKGSFVWSVFTLWIPVRFFVTGNMTNGMCYCITKMLFIWFCPF